MLRSIKIINYAIINEAEINFSEQFNVITGETGAGKSILLGALSLLLGNRADSKIFFDKQKKCIVEGIFRIKDYDLKNFFDEENIDYENETIIRRELNEAGKSRAFINDVPVTLSTLEKLMHHLITIHSQHETLSLGESKFQLMVIDALAGNTKLLDEYKTKFLKWKKVSRQLKDAEESATKSVSEKDFIEFQLNELIAASLHDMHAEELENELQQLNHAGEIKKNLQISADSLSASENSLHHNLRFVIAQLNAIASFFPEIKAYIERLESSAIEIKDIARDFEHKAGIITADSQRAEEIQQKLNILYRLLKKHNAKTKDELIKIKQAFEDKLNAFTNDENTIELLTVEQKKLFDAVITLSQKLSAKRKDEFEPFIKQVKKLLHQVGMKNAELQIEHTYDSIKQLNESGADSIQFLFSANAGSLPQDIKKIASGGELSRLMLCIKSLLARSVALPTLLFDEIDTGVSGETANKVGNILLQLSVNHQVIAITHLPQIAGKGKHHLYVYKEVSQNKTQTKMRQLNYDERIVEIAKMLSGDSPSKAALSNAQELIQN